MKPDFQGVRTRWNQGFIAFPAGPACAIVVLMLLM